MPEKWNINDEDPVTCLIFTREQIYSKSITSCLAALAMLYAHCMTCWVRTRGSRVGSLEISLDVATLALHCSRSWMDPLVR